MLSSETKQERAESLVAQYEAAGIFARIAAAFVDYLVISAGFFLGQMFVPNPDYHFVFGLAFSALYFTVGSSWITQGQTLGKKVFGLKTVNLSKTSRLPYLGINKSFVRYLLTYGLIIIVAEVPTLIYRAQEIVGSPMLIDSHMLLAFCYFFCNCASVFLLYNHRGLHEIAVNSAVIRRAHLPSELSAKTPLTIDNIPEQYRDAPVSRRRLAISLILGTLIASFFWGLSVYHSAEILALHSKRFPIENKLQLRIINAELHPESAGNTNSQIVFVVQALVVNSKPEHSDRSPLAIAFVSELVEQNIINPAKVPRVRLTLMVPGNSPDRGVAIEDFEVDTSSREIVKPESLGINQHAR